MIRRLAVHILVYVTGAVLLVWLTWKAQKAGDLPLDAENLILILTIGWIVAYFQILGLLGMRRRWRLFLLTMEKVSLQIQQDRLPEESDLARLTEDMTEMARSELHWPRFILRRLVRKVLDRLVEQARRDARSGGGGAAATGDSDQ